MKEGFKLKTDAYGRTELTLAILHHETDKALKLFDEYGDVDYKDAVGFYDFFYAVREGQLELVEEMLKKGANPNIQNSNGSTPLTGVLECAGVNATTTDRIIKIAKLLLDAGADLQHKNIMGETIKELSKFIAAGPVSDYLCNYDSKK